MDNIILSHLPMPPILNHRLMPVGGRLIKSPDARTFDKAVQLWILRQKGGIYDVRRRAKEWIDVGYCLRVSLEFYWPKEKLISKAGVPKRLDLDGRLKAAIDAISEIIDIDDKWVIEIDAYKIHWPNAWEEVNAVLTPVHWRDTSEVA